MSEEWFDSAEAAMEKVKSMSLKDGLREALDWRSDDFGHNCHTLLEAESAAFNYFGQIFLNTYLEARDGVENECDLGYYTDRRASWWIKKHGEEK